MTLDEAIAHAKELSESQSVCEDCREEHKQLAEWLEELKQYKEENQPEKTAEDHKDIRFSLTRQQFYAQCDFDPKDINMREFKAIQKQIKELGWL